jgi:hypothetical protein
MLLGSGSVQRDVWTALTCFSPGFSTAIPPCSLELDLVVSGAADGALLLHSLSSGLYVRSLFLPHGVTPTLLCVVPKLGE